MVSSNRCVGSIRGDFAPEKPTILADVEDITLPIHVSYSKTIAQLKMQLVKYREALIENGIEPPDADGADLQRMWDSCVAVISAAHLALAELGTSKELLFAMRK